MLGQSHISCYDPVFLKYGQQVYSSNFIKDLREEILAGENDSDLIPQEGFQESVCLNDADVLIVGGRRGGGKAQCINELVVTPFGLRRLGDLKVGDIISDPVTGGMQRVIQVHEHPNKDLYRIHFSDGVSTTCCAEHLWKIKRTNYTHKTRYINGTGQEADWRIWSFEQIKTFLDRQERGEFKTKQKNNLLIPLCAPIRLTKSGPAMVKPELDPYIIGALLGNGCFTTDYITYATNLGDTVTEFEKEGFDMTHFSQKGDCINYRFSKEDRDRIVPWLEKWKLIGKKAIDKRYYNGEKDYETVYYYNPTHGALTSTEKKYPDGRKEKDTDFTTFEFYYVEK